MIDLGVILQENSTVITTFDRKCVKLFRNLLSSVFIHTLDFDDRNWSQFILV